MRAIFTQVLFLSSLKWLVLKSTPFSLAFLLCRFVHRGPSERYPKRAEDYKIRGGGNALERRALANARRTGKDLQQWIDSLTTRYLVIP